MGNVFTKSCFGNSTQGEYLCEVLPQFSSMGNTLVKFYLPQSNSFRTLPWGYVFVKFRFCYSALGEMSHKVYRFCNSTREQKSLRKICYCSSTLRECLCKVPLSQFHSKTKVFMELRYCNSVLCNSVLMKFCFHNSAVGETSL